MILHEANLEPDEEQKILNLMGAAKKEIKILIRLVEWGIHAVKWFETHQEIHINSAAYGEIKSIIKDIQWTQEQ